MALINVFKAYAAGCNIVILASTFERVQIIPGAIHDYVRISSVDCSSDTGKIAAAYDDVVCIYEPTPLIHNNSSHVSCIYTGVIVYWYLLRIYIRLHL